MNKSLKQNCSEDGLLLLVGTYRWREGEREVGGGGSAEPCQDLMITVTILHSNSFTDAIKVLSIFQVGSKVLSKFRYSLQAGSLCRRSNHDALAKPV